MERATQAFLNSLQIASLNAMEKGMLSFGPANTTVLVFEDLMDSKALWLTPNTVSIYMGLWMEIGDEPMVMKTPPNVLGFIDDTWFNYVVDFGNAGPDKGKGGKFLILPRPVHLLPGPRTRGTTFILASEYGRTPSSKGVMTSCLTALACSTPASTCTSTPPVSHLRWR